MHHKNIIIVIIYKPQIPGNFFGRWLLYGVTEDVLVLCMTSIFIWLSNNIVKILLEFLSEELSLSSDFSNNKKGNPQKDKTVQRLNLKSLAT